MTYESQIQKKLYESIPDGYICKMDDWKEGFFGNNGIILWKDNEKFVYKKSSIEIINKILSLDDEALPEIVWYNKQSESYIRKWVYGISMRNWYQCLPMTYDWKKWYIIENYKIWKRVGGHGDFTDLNVIITYPDYKIKWIDLNKCGEDFNSFVRYLKYHFGEKHSEEDIIKIIEGKI